MKKHIFKKDLSMIGKKFGKWTVLEEMDSDKPGKHFECMCECGTITIVPATTLRAGRSKQCKRCMYEKILDVNDITGKVFGKWTVVGFLGIKNRCAIYKARCECGNYGKHYSSDLRAGKTTQCRDCGNKQGAITNTKHGMHTSSEYRIWQAMIQRCNNPKSTGYKWYGARGIKVCERWKNSFKDFYRDMGARPKGLTLDRIDNDGDYEPSNCRWVTHKENCNNR